MQLQIFLYTRQERISSDSPAMIHRADKMQMTRLLHPDLSNGGACPKLRALRNAKASHFFNTTGNINLPEGVTALKSGTPYCFDCFWNLHLTESYAFTKCILSNRCHSFIYDHLVNLRLFVLPGTPFTGTSIVEIRHFPFTGYRNGLIVSADRPFNICAEDRILDVRKRSIQHRAVQPDSERYQVRPSPRRKAVSLRPQQP